MTELLTGEFYTIVLASFLVGIVVGLTGMGGGALMTPAMIFLGVGHTAQIVAADLAASAASKTGGAIVHARAGSAHWRLTFWLVVGSVPTALIAPSLASWTFDPKELDNALKVAIGFTLLFAATTYAVRLWLNLGRVRSGGPEYNPDPTIRPVPTVLVGALGGLLVGITSVGAGSVIMVALLMLYPGLAAVKVVGTDMVQGIPLVLAAAVANIWLHGLDWGLLIPLMVGSVPGTVIGSQVAPKMPQSFIRRAIVVVLTISGVALLDKSNWGPFTDHTSPLLILGTGLAMVVLVPLIWGFIRTRYGLPMFGAPYVSELDEPHRQRSRDKDAAPRD